MQKYAKYMQKMQNIDTTAYFQTISQKMFKYGLKTDLPAAGRSGVKYAFYIYMYNMQFPRKVSMCMQARTYICSYHAGSSYYYACLFAKLLQSGEQQWRCFLLYWQSARIAANQRFCNLSPFYIRWCDVGCTPSDSQNAYDMQCNQERCVARLTC